jgi:coenzyme F420 hydrogenase subunit delta
MIAEFYAKPILVLGCGNTLLGDDGFGPAAVEHLLAHHQLPPEVLAADVGTSISELLFDLLLAAPQPRSLLILDAANPPDKEPGELFELGLDQMAPPKASGFCLHQFPGANLLAQLERVPGLKVKVLAVAARDIPEQVRPGLSPQVQAALPRACAWVMRQIEEAT